MTTPTADDQQSSLLEPYASRWQLAVRPAGLAVWTAERRERGGSIRYVVATSPRELAAKLADIEAEEARQ
jgi:hypothetical protein